jgi:hypothetical protein
MESDKKDLVDQKRSNQIPFSGYNTEVLFSEREIDPNEESFEVDQITEPPPPIPDFVEELTEESSEEDDFLSLKSLSDGMYCLFYEDQLVLNGTKDKIKNYLSEVILNDVPVESFSVLKKVTLKVGISLDE